MFQVRNAAFPSDSHLLAARRQNGESHPPVLTTSISAADRRSMSRRSRLSALCTALLVTLSLIPGSKAAFAQTVVRFPGATPVNTPAATIPVTVAFTRAGGLDAIRVRTQGNDNIDFKNTSDGTCSTGISYSAGQQCTVTVSFTPTAPGERRGAIILLDSNKNVLASQLLTATATGPVSTFIPGTIDTVAGDNTWIYAGDGGQANQSSIFLPFGVAVDANGDIFISDSSNNRIRMVNVFTGVISTIAGNGALGSTGDGGAATSATISNPTAIAVDPAGNVFFADNGNNVIRKINAFDGTISTIAGKINVHGYSGDNGPATSATLNAPNGIAFDAMGDLYIADTTNNVIRKVSAETGIITTIAGTGVSGFSGDGGLAVSSTLNTPWGVTVSSAGLLYIADQGNNRIRVIDTAGLISTIIGNGNATYTGDNGPASAATVNVPAGIAIDAAGNTYIADSGNNVIRKINVASNIVTTVAGNGSESITGDKGSAIAAGLYGPYSINMDSLGNLVIADVFHNRIRKLYANPSVLVFPPIRAGRTSPSETQILENDGNAPLNVAAITPISNAQVDSAKTTCFTTAPLLPLAQCNVAVNFTPTIVGNPVLGSVNVSSDASNSPGVIELAGQVLDVDPATVTLTSSANPSITGATVIFNVAVSSVGTTPTGAVTLLDGTTTLASGQLGPGGNITFNVSTLTAGNHSMTASYAGDSNNAAGVSPAIVQVVQDPVANTNTTLSTSSNPVFAGAPLTLTAQVQPAIVGSGKGSITGTVTFKYGAQQLGSANITNGVASINYNTLPVGADTILAVYGGSSTYATSSSSPFVENVQIATTHISLSTSANPSPAGAALTLSASVTGNGGIAGGMVTFFDGAVNLGNATLNAQGTATLPVSGPSWTVGVHNLTAVYAGDSLDAASTSSPVAENIGLATTTVKLASSLNPAALSANVTLSGSVTGNGGTPTGSLRFLDGTAVIGSATLNAQGVASLTVSNLTIGTHTITATYSGDNSDSASTSPALAQVIQPATIAASLNSSVNPALFGSPLTLNVSVTGDGSTPVGTVTFSDGTTVLGTVTLTAQATASLVVSNLVIGSHSLTAAYSGDANHSPVGSNTLVQNVVQGTSTTLSATNLNPIAGTPVTYTAAVTGANGQPTTGPIGMYDGKTLLGTVTPNSAGVATMSGVFLAPGAHILTATFAGDNLDATSTSAPVNSNIVIATTAATLVSSVNPSFSGNPVVFTATVSGNGGVPTGTVAFMDGSTLLSKVSLTSSGIAILTTSSLAPGLHRITANYSGDTNDAAVVSATVVQQVAQQSGVTLTSSANPSLLSDNITLSTTVSNGVAGAVPTGKVTLTDGGTAIATATLDGNGGATFPITAPTAGTHNYIVSYAGDDQNVPATSTTLVQIVKLRPTVTSLSASATAISTGQQLVLISVVQGSGTSLPTGSVTFSSGSTVFGSATIGSNGLATISVAPQQGVFNITGTYSGDALYATSASSTVLVTVGPPIEFALSMQPPSLTLKSGDHGTIQVSISTAATFKDTVAFGCAGLPASATCTFSNDKMAVGGGATSNLSVIVDTGNPLGVGATAKLDQPGHGSGTMLAFLPAAALLLCFGSRGRKLLANARKPLGLIVALLMLAGVATLSGCGNTFNTTDTPAGSYTFQIVGTGQSTGATQVGTVTLTVK